MQIGLQSSTQSKKIPEPPALPIVGSLPFVDKHKHQYISFTKLAKEYGDIFQLRIFFRKIIVLNGLETIRQALLKQSEDFAGRPDLSITKKVVRGRNIGGRDYGLLWKRHREITVNALHMFLDNKTSLIENQIVDDAVELANIFLSYEGQSFEPDMDISLSVTNIMSKILFGEKYSRDNQDLVALVKLTQLASRNGVGSLRFDFLPKPPNIFQKFQKSIDNVLESMVLNKLEEYRNSYDPTNLRGMADALLNASDKISELEKQTLGLTEDLIVKGTVQEMMGSGTQPVSPILSWTILYMIAYPDIQAQIQQELDTVIGTEQPVRFEDRTRLPFTQACIHEIMRHAPYFPTALPHATTTDTTINGYFIPKNTPVYINLYSLTRDDRYWEEPEQFNPHRFLSDRREIREDLLDKYYPFGLGKRRCFGEYLGRLEVFLFFSNLMHRCKFAQNPGDKLNFECQTGAVTMPKETYKVTVKPRF
ncbi:MAG: cytochrome P450 [Hapalosiphonaceae cyanobacterium JJU2]|nr:MAG: cytochrome P450 [Hapalosiphonaceae cyanobacterium JJU2]